MPRPELSRVPDFYHNYISQVKENDLMDAFSKQSIGLPQFLKSIPADKREFRYADGKWTIKELLQHLIDSERIFAYRALCFARKDTTPLPSFDENLYADNSKAEKRNWDEMVEELIALRKANLTMFNSFDNEQLETSGTASGKSNYVLAIGFILVGHINHHVNVIRERYLNNVAAKV